MNHRKELECMCSFATTAWDAEADYELLRCLWTAFCVHQDVDIDTLEYDTGLHLLYMILRLSNPDRNFFKSQEEFDVFMRKHLS